MPKPEWWRWDRWEPEEVLSPYGLYLLERDVCPLSFRAMDHLQGFGEYLDLPLYCNLPGGGLRGYRSALEFMEMPERESEREHSFHCSGVAFDIYTPVELVPADFLTSAVSFGWRGIGVYDWGLHLDMADGPMRQWVG